MAGHVSLEAALFGSIAALRDGDIIRFDVSSASWKLRSARRFSGSA
jgi:dihydroxyacid dehydratase/phosphogluconate dehydratase